MGAFAERFESEPVLEPEPGDWQIKALTLGVKLWCGAIAFFFAAFVFAYFYLRSLDPNHGWKIGHHVSPSGGLGVTIMAVYLLSGILLWLGARRPDDELSTGVAAIVLALIGVGLQFLEYSTLGFGPASGGYASVFIGWTAMYALSGLLGVYWIETHVAAIWRARRNGWSDADPAELRAGLQACSLGWVFFVAIGVLMFVVLYLV
jgi:heme/copper-type cytochrome/quinol oxidase subunit 3